MGKWTGCLVPSETVKQKDTCVFREEKKKKINTTQFQLLHTWNSGECFGSFVILEKDLEGTVDELLEPRALGFTWAVKHAAWNNWGWLSEVDCNGSSKLSLESASVWWVLAVIFPECVFELAKAPSLSIWFHWFGVGLGSPVLSLSPPRWVRYAGAVRIQNSWFSSTYGWRKGLLWG